MLAAFDAHRSIVLDDRGDSCGAHSKLRYNIGDITGIEIKTARGLQSSIIWPTPGLLKHK